MKQIIEIKNLSKRFKGNTLFCEANLSVEAGQTIGIVGENGCGKSILLKMIAGLEPFQDGTVAVDGKKLGIDVDFPENMGILINSSGYLENNSGFQNLKYLADINHKIDDKTIIETMKAVGLEPENKLKVKHYSVGMKQKLGIAQAIMEGQNVLLLDEVFNGLDYQSAKEIKNLIRHYQACQFTIILTSHYFSDLKELCDPIYIIENKAIRQLEKKEYTEYMN